MTNETAPIDETQFTPLLGCLIPKALSGDGIIKIGQGDWEFVKTPRELTYFVHCDMCGFALEAFRYELRYCSMCASPLPVRDDWEPWGGVRELQEVSEE